MANVFDQFDEGPRGGGNPFDQFDQPPEPASNQAAQEEPQGSSAMDTARFVQDAYGAARSGAIDTAAQFVTGALAEPVAGLAGIYGAATGGPEKGSRLIEQTRDFLTYEPESLEGRAVSEAAGRKIAPIAEAAESVSEFAGEAGFQAGGPAAGAAAYTVPVAIAEILGMKGTRAVKRSAIEAAVNEEGAGVLTPEARKELIDSGIYTEKELSDIAGTDAEYLERLARFQRLGVQPTKGDITQRLEEQKPEAQLFQSAQDESGASMRELRQQQSQVISTSIEDMIDQTGVPSDIGNSIKDALQSRKTLMRDRARDAYEALGQQAEATNVPILLDDYTAVEGFPDAGQLRDISTEMPNQVRAFKDAMAEFGLSDDAASLKRLEAEGVVPEQLSIANAERLRQRLNRFERADSTGNMSRIIAPVKRELDKQIEVASDALERSGNPNVAALAKEARQNYRALKEEFDPKGLTSKLIEDRKGSTIPQVESSQVYQKLSATSTPIEQVDRIIQSLKGEGAKGQRAIADLQASIMMDLLDSAFTGTTKKVDGQAMVSGPAMARRFGKISDKARVVFQDNPGALRRLEEILQTAEDITPQGIAVPKGSAGFIMDVLERTNLLSLAQSIPGGTFVVEGLRSLGARSANRSSLNKALDANPKLKRSATILATDYPSLAAALGIGYLAQQESEENDTNQNQ